MRYSRIAGSWLAVAGLLLGACNSAKAQGITQQQAEDMLKELRAIRQALERVTPPPPGQAADQRVRLQTVGEHVMGRPDAPVTIVEFTDLQCPFCNRFLSTTFPQIKKTYIDTGKVRFVSRDFPLNLHAFAMQAARAARCAGEQGKFWEMRMALMAGYNRLSPAFVTSTAQSLGLDTKALDACAASTKYDAAIQKDMDDARTVNVEGTPTFVVGRTAGEGLDGVLVVGAQPFSVFSAKIEALLGQAR